MVGVAGDNQFHSIGVKIEPLVYRPYAQNPLSAMLTVVIRTPLGVDQRRRSIRETVWQVDPDAPVVDEKPFRAVVSESIASQRLIAFLLNLFGLPALVLGRRKRLPNWPDSSEIRQAHRGSRGALRGRTKELQRRKGTCLFPAARIMPLVSAI